MNKYIVELIGTFFLVTDHRHDGAGAERRRGHGSAGHWLGADGDDLRRRARLGRPFQPGRDAGRLPARQMPAIRTLSPIGLRRSWAAVVAAFIAIWMKGKGAAEPVGMDIPKLLVAEFLYTFALCYVVLNVATAKGTSGNSFYGLAIGFTVLTGAYAVGAVSGGAFNPAVVAGLIVMGKLTIAHLWIYLVANLGAAVVAAIAFKTINPGDK